MSKFAWEAIDRKAIDTARLLAADAVEKVGNGHPGTAMSLAPVAYALYQRHMNLDPSDPKWLGRDRFILSAGHSSLTQYVQLYLGGFGLELVDLKSLRTWGSKTPGHPEYGHTAHVEITTGPLGQGLASAVGFAYAARFERGLLDPEAPAGESPFDHFVYVIAGDGDIQEGVTSEAGSLAGHQQLGNLIALYDANQISIEDDTNIAFTEDVAARYRAYGWHVLELNWRASADNGGAYVEDLDALSEAIETAKSVSEQPSLIIVRTIIGFPAPKKQNTGKIHGSALGADELAATKQALGFDPEQHFAVDPEVIAHTRSLQDRAREARSEWDASFEAWKQREPQRAELLKRLEAGALPDGLESAIADFEPGTALATRAASGKVLNQIAAVMPELWGGSADLAESNLTTISGADSFAPSKWSTHEWTASPHGRVLHYGIREHAMGSIMNGIALHGLTRPFGGTFLIFSDYMRPAVRLAALMGIAPIYVWTHDSIALGEDGPTHQPAEQLASLRAIPNLGMVRPADANETKYAWLEALRRTTQPTGIALTRQAVPTFERGAAETNGEVMASAEATRFGGYVLLDSPTSQIDVVLIASGSEVQLAVAARATLAELGFGARVVSMPSLDWFAEQPAEYRNSVIPTDVTARVSVEAGLALSWHDLLGNAGVPVSLEHFGASADGDTLYREFGITAEAVVAAAQQSIAAATQKN